MRAIRHSLMVEPAGVDDIPSIMAIERMPGYSELVGCYEAGEHLRRMAAPTCTYLLGRDAGEVVGFAVVRRDDDGMGTAQLHRIAVSSPGNGYGLAFMQEICRWVFEEHDIDRLWLDVLASNQRAVCLYAALGFVKEGVMRESLRLGEGRHDLVLMSLLRRDWTQQSN
ncbi:RimJ/RimL family protein N-acetyltransferase [Pseudorhizobium tarimense]|uniref:RimJ/RimL family protein N-acetyltransferase n=1 Tax=Pseudorhizobium tarimense TaxID=1079109 RepID=A0ABV2HCW9_9HYPH